MKIPTLECGRVACALKQSAVQARRRVRQRHRQCSAQSLTEFALIAPLFFLLVFGIIDFGRLFFTQMTLQHAMREAGRFGVTGNKLDDSKNNGQKLSRVASIREMVARTAGGLGVDPQNVRITRANADANAPDSAGGPSETFTISLQYSLQLVTPIIGQFFPNGAHVFTVQTTFKNEPFEASQAN